MKNKIFLLVCAVALPLMVFPQVKDFVSLIERQEYDKVMTYITQAYGEDTLNADRNYILYRYYAHKDNPNRDSLSAFGYLKKSNYKKQGYNEDIQLIAQSLLSVVYSYKDVDKLNRYIELTPEFDNLNKEAQRIRNRLAYEQVVQSKDINQYKLFIEKYPTAVQSDDARAWINENTIESLVKNENIEELKAFANTTTTESYKKKALQEIDRLSFKQALKENTMDSYARYIKEFPQGAYLNMAKANLDKVQYRQYVQLGNISDMLSYLQTHSSSDKNYNEVLDRLKVLAVDRYSLAAMKKVYSLTSDDKLLERFAKRYISDWKLQSIDNLIEAFPKLEQADFVVQTKSKAEKLDALYNKEKLTAEDYTKNKSLFKDLKPTAVKEVFARFETLSSSLPEKKRLKFNLYNDIDYIQFKNAQSTELNFILAEKPDGYVKSNELPDVEQVGLLSDDAFISSDKRVILFSKADTDGYDYYEGTENRDIYVCLYENHRWSEPFVLNENVNSRVNDCRPVLSEDKKTLWFSSSRTLNFGGLDIYVCYRQDTTDWNAWSEPVLLGEDFNTADNDYVSDVRKDFIVITQDENFQPDNNLYLEGSIADNFFHSSLNTKSALIKGTEIYVLDDKSFNTLNVVRTDEKGFFAFLKPKKDFLLLCKKRNHFSPLSGKAQMYNYDTILVKQEIVTIESPFNQKGNLTEKGKRDLVNLAETFASSSVYSSSIITVGVHAVEGNGKMNAKELSDKQAEQIADLFIKHGLDKERFVVTGYGKDNLMQGWNDRNNIDIGVIKR